MRTRLLTLLLDPSGNSVQWDVADSSVSLSSELQDHQFSTGNSSLSIFFQNSIPEYETSLYLTLCL